MMHSRSLKLLLTLSAALALALPSTASASKTMQVGISDEGVTQRNPALGAQVIPQWKTIGMDVSRVMIIWSYVAPDSEEVTEPSGFDPTNPNDPKYNWSAIDQTMAQLKTAGIEPVVAVTGPGPIWASTDKTAEDQRYRPDPAKFAQFVEAAAKRYGPEVNRWLIWNEPNVNSWLMPQQECKGGKCIPLAPVLYRGLVRAAYPVLKSEDPGSTVIAGTLAPRGQTPNKAAANVRPLAFLRAFGCVDAKLRPESKSKYCKGFKAPVADGFAYHPHGTLFAPTKKLPNKDEASLADFGSRLLPTLDGIQKKGRFLNAGSKTKKFDVYFTEYGYQTNPPDPYQGVSTTEQLNWVQEGSFMSWRQPRVKMLIQYLWRDDPVGDRGQGSRAYSGWQSGLYSFDGRKKPLRDAFPNPFWVDLPKRKKTATVWGQVRPGGAARVTVQKKNGTSWSTLRTAQTNAEGYFAFTTTVSKKSSYRFRYALDDESGSSNTVTAAKKTYTSSVMTVTPRKK
jgi:hypothetical protein